LVVPKSMPIIFAIFISLLNNLYALNRVYLDSFK